MKFEKVSKTKEKLKKQLNDIIQNSEKIKKELTDKGFVYNE